MKQACIFVSLVRKQITEEDPHFAPCVRSVLPHICRVNPTFFKKLLFSSEVVVLSSVQDIIGYINSQRL
jgi:hypothetical protein